MDRVRSASRILGILVLAAVLGAGSRGVLGVCGPFLDLTDAGFCPFVLEIFTIGITTGTSPTTYDPASSVSRLQMAAFLSRTVDASLKRGSPRAALGQFWVTKYDNFGYSPVSGSPVWVRSDGKDLWVSNPGNNTVVRVRGSDGGVLGTWTGLDTPYGLAVAMNRIVVAGKSSPGKLHVIDPSQAPGAATVVASTLGGNPRGLAFDGAKFWTANQGEPPSVSIVTPGAAIPWTVTTVTAGFTYPQGILFDGASIWMTDITANTLVKLDGAGAILLTVTVGVGPRFPIFDGSNIWVPNSGGGSATVVRASNGAILATLTGNGLAGVTSAAFDGQRVLVTSSDTLSLWKAADLTPLGSFPTGVGSAPFGACSDGSAFWVTLSGEARLARF